MHNFVRFLYRIDKKCVNPRRDLNGRSAPVSSAIFQYTAFFSRCFISSTGLENPGMRAAATFRFTGRDHYTQLFVRCFIFKDQFLDSHNGTSATHCLRLVPGCLRLGRRFQSPIRHKNRETTIFLLDAEPRIRKISLLFRDIFTHLLTIKRVRCFQF